MAYRKGFPGPIRPFTYSGKPHFGLLNARTLQFRCERLREAARGRWCAWRTRSGTRAPKPPFCSRGESTGDAGAVRDEMTGEATGGLLEEDEAPPLPLFPEALPERGRCELPGEEHEVR